ncbi:unnamed protein product [Nesidiocoris tenuis]|uniref:Uncharacterized protein n=1 Tax=Nesidiocoris tenuis TaxID=355587 RepID=A0A6H5FW69_9HEMI|nr:unnamed protein product [Nesidiocoris tenuis]
MTLNPCSIETSIAQSLNLSNKKSSRSRWSSVWGTRCPHDVARQIGTNWFRLVDIGGPHSQLQSNQVRYELLPLAISGYRDFINAKQLIVSKWKYWNPPKIENRNGASGKTFSCTQNLCTRGHTLMCTRGHLKNVVRRKLLFDRLSREGSALITCLILSVHANVSRIQQITYLFNRLYNFRPSRKSDGLRFKFIT